MAEYDGSAENCIFCKIARREIPAHIIWESDTHMAFLTIFPNTEGFTVVIPKEHLSSAVLELPSADYVALLSATQEVAELLKNAFDDVGRVGLIVEGLGVDHAHTKLIPLHGTASLDDEWKQHASSIDKFYEHYPGYMSSHDGPRMDDGKLVAIAELIRAKTPAERLPRQE